MQGFGGRMAHRVDEVGTALVVGLDPHPGRLPRSIADRLGADPEGALVDWSVGVIDAVAPLVAAVKPQVAFYEAWGARGWAALEAACARARQVGLPVILDAKRGDIGSTAEAYARATLDDGGPIGADAVTLSPWLGPESLDPFVQRARHGKGLFVLVRTSNPGADLWQRTSAEVARWIASTNAELGGGPGPIGAVVGATVDGRPWRSLLGDAWILAPGVGAQGAGAGDLVGHAAAGGSGVLPVAARSVLYGSEPEGDEWVENVATRALEHAHALARAENAW